MTTSIQVDKPCSSEFNKEIAYLLDYARMKLLTEMPRQLRMVSYLRLCCIAIRKLQQQPELSSKNSLQVAFNDSYLYLLQALCQSSPEWWKYCWSSNRGILKSDDATIERLLQPLESFIDIYTCKYSSIEIDEMSKGH
jgi:hypothetical protein